MAAPRPDPWWHPFRSDPGLAEGLSIWVHLLAVGIALTGTVVFGVILGMNASLLAGVSSEIAGVFGAIGIVLAFSALFSWAGHLPGALVLHLALVNGWGGWAVALAGGLVVGILLSALIGGLLPVVLGPFLALIHLVALRWMASVFRPAGNAAPPPEPEGLA